MKENEELLTDKEIQDRMDELARSFILGRYRMTKILISLVGSGIVLCFIFNFSKKLALWLDLPRLARFPINALVIIFSIVLLCFVLFVLLYGLNIIITIPQMKEWLRLEEIQRKRSKEKTNKREG